MMHSPLQIRTLFNYLPDAYFFVKDRQGRFMMANEIFVRQCGVRREEDIVGRNDYDFFPRERAENYVRDDRYVMGSGQPILNRVELAPERDNSINWFVTTKVPVLSSDGEIIGLAGIARDIRQAGLALRPYTEMRAALEYIRDHYAEPIHIRDLAAQVHLSVSQFERRFRRVFQITPFRHILQVRIRAACTLLTTTNDTIAAIALDCGFYDHAHFTRQFKKVMGVPPRKYRNRNAG